MSIRKTWDKKLDDEIRAFEHDLSASIDAFVEPVQPPVPFVPPPAETVSPPPPRPVEPAPSAAPAPAAPATGLLAELRRAAQQQNKHDEAAAQQRHEREQRVAKLMRALFNYLSELCRHLDAARLPVSAQFRISPKALIEGLRWQDSFIDYRTASSSELAPITRISLRYTLSAPGAVPLECPQQLAASQQEDLKTLGLRYWTSRHAGGSDIGDTCAFQVNREVRVSLSLMPNYDQEVLILRTKNFAGLGPADYSLPTRELNQALFDELGNYMLGRPNTLLSRLHPERYQQP